MNWIAHQHALLTHLPVAVGLLLPWALIAAQRPGRGIRPWWTVSRYLAWAGLLGLVTALASGYTFARFQSLIPPHRLLPTVGIGAGIEGLLFRHFLFALVTLLLAAGAAWAMSRPRKEHQSLGILTLLLGLAWSVGVLLVGESGYRLAHGVRANPTKPLPVAPLKAAVEAPALRPSERDPEATTPWRLLDFTAMEAIHPDPVKSLAHGRRWIRAWVSPEAAATYRAGRALPVGALVVLSSVEERWGRPGPDIGPLYGLEMKPTGPSLTFYWPRIPQAASAEFGGESRVYWRGDDPHLEACRACHAGGLADAAQRSRWRAKKIG